MSVSSIGSAVPVAQRKRTLWHYRPRGPGTAMSHAILVGVDAHLSLPTRYALEAACCQFLEQPSPECRMLLLHVIPVPYDPSPRWGRPAGSLSLFPPTTRQRCEARQALSQARALLGHLGVPDSAIEVLVQVGIPADELVWVARERHVGLLVLGSHAPSRFQILRRAVFGSTTRRVLRLAPCRVLLAHPPGPSGSGDLVTWYEQATLCCLQQATALVILTPREVARRFAPSYETDGNRDVAAAACALERLAQRGLLLCRVVNGEVRCWND
jgi:nucleotide-binding universal stress UspA family protein